MLFQEIMRLEPFEGATVLVGDTRGEHQVKAVYVSDGSNIPEKAERGRSEERRVGKECRSRWSPYH